MGILLIKHEVLSYQTSQKHKYTKCVKSSIYKLVNAVTKSVPSSGKSSPTNTESTQLVPTTETAIFNLKELTYTTMKPPVANTSHVPFLSILCRKQLGQRSLHRGSRTCRLRPRCCPKGSRELRLPSRIPTYTLPRWRYRFRNGNTSYQQNP